MVRFIGIVLLLAGIAALAYGGFSYTRQTHEAKLGPLEFSIRRTETIDVPVWAGVAAALVGGLLLAVGGRK
jgi:drug/metabolite transporter (DMT)-like permease